MIDSIRLIRFKKFKETRLELRPFTILAGGNNAGKTTVLEAIWLALHSLHEGRLLSVDRRTLQSKVSGTGCYLFDLPFVSREDLSGLFYNRISRNSSTYDENSGAMLELTDERGNELKLHVRELFKNINVKLLTPEEELRAPRLQARAPLYLQGGRGVKLQEERLFPAAMEARIAQDGSSSALRNMILDLKKQMPQKYQYLEQLMEEAFAFQICEMQFDENRERYLISKYQEKGTAEAVRLEFGNCGSGMLNILQLLAAILRYCPEKSEVVLLDCPDAGLDGPLSLKLMDTLRKIQEELGIQIILTSDSETVLRDADPEEVIPVIAGAKVNRPLWIKDQKSAKPVDIGLDAYDLAQAVSSRRLVLCSLEKEEAELLQKIIARISGAGVLPAWICAEEEQCARIKETISRLFEKEISVFWIKEGTHEPETENIRTLQKRAVSELLLATEVLRRAISAVAGRSNGLQMEDSELQAERERAFETEAPVLEILCWLEREKGIRIRMRELVRQLKAEDLPESLAELVKAPELPVDNGNKKAEEEADRKQHKEYEQLSLTLQE